MVLWVRDIAPSTQGEGLFAGLPVIILRMMTCNFKCSASEGGFNCDTFDTWKKGFLNPGRKLSVGSIVKEVLSYKTDYRDTVMLTGGEPLLWQGNSEFRDLIGRLYYHGISTHVETNGSFEVRDDVGRYIDYFAISPKQTQYKNYYKPEVVKSYFPYNHFWKFVIRTQENFNDVVEFLSKYNIPKTDKVFLMPEGITEEQLTHSNETFITPNLITLQRLGYINIKTSERRQIMEGFK
ncbi:MAG: 7-carboxy-7-deazaguanine synthase QueE [Candidatus Parvarchaeum sp.]